MTQRTHTCSLSQHCSAGNSVPMPACTSVYAWDTGPRDTGFDAADSMFYSSPAPLKERKRCSLCHLRLRTFFLERCFSLSLRCNVHACVRKHSPCAVLVTLPLSLSLSLSLRDCPSSPLLYLQHRKRCPIVLPPYDTNKGEPNVQARECPVLHERACGRGFSLDVAQEIKIK